MSTPGPTTHPCPTCGGKGYRYAPADGWQPPDERECSACDGSGVERLEAHEADLWTADDEEAA